MLQIDIFWNRINSRKVQRRVESYEWSENSGNVETHPRSMGSNSCSDESARIKGRLRKQRHKKLILFFSFLTYLVRFADIFWEPVKSYISLLICDWEWEDSLHFHNVSIKMGSWDWNFKGEQIWWLFNAIQWPRNNDWYMKNFQWRCKLIYFLYRKYITGWSRSIVIRSLAWETKEIALLNTFEEHKFGAVWRYKNGYRHSWKILQTPLIRDCWFSNFCYN